MVNHPFRLSLCTWHQSFRHFPPSHDIGVAPLCVEPQIHIMPARYELYLQRLMEDEDTTHCHTLCNVELPYRYMKILSVFGLCSTFSRTTFPAAHVTGVTVMITFAFGWGSCSFVPRSSHYTDESISAYCPRDNSRRSKPHLPTTSTTLS